MGPIVRPPVSRVFVSFLTTCVQEYTIRNQFDILVAAVTSPEIINQIKVLTSYRKHVL